MPNIIPITDLRDTNKVAELCSSSNEPVFITKNGYGTMVIMSMKLYEEDKEEKLILSRLANARNGNVIDTDTVIKEIREKYGL